MRSSLAVALFAAALAACGGGSTNAPPSALDDQASTQEDEVVVVDVLANDTDPDGDPLEIVEVVADAGEVAIVDGGIRVTPAADFSGEIHVNVWVSDGDASRSSDLVVTVTPVNDAPTAIAATVTTGRNDSVAITLTGEDVDGDTLEFAIAAAPGHGALEGTGPELTYLPETDYVGADELRFVVSDGNGGMSETATIAIAVTAGATPVAAAQTATTAEDTAIEVLLAGEDADGDALTYAVTSPALHGIVTGTAPHLTYTPSGDFHGTDTFAFTATDGVLTSAPAQVTIDVTPVNDVPDAVPSVVSTSEDTALSIPLVASDADGDALGFAIASAPAHGSVVVTGNTALYTPASDSNGSDTFTFTASDGTSTSEAAPVSVTILATPDAPVAVAQSANGVEDAPLAITLAATDGDGDVLSYTVAADPAHGTLTGAPPALVYTPAANYHGPDSLTFVASDGSQSSAPATVAIGVAAVDDPPIAASFVVALVEDQPATFGFGPATDVDGEALTYTVLAPPAHGTLTGSGVAGTYTPAANTHGNDPFTYQVSDGHSAPSGTVTLAVAPVNDAPIANDDLAIATPGQPITIGVVDNDEDAEGDALVITGIWPPAHGDATWGNGEIVYTPDPGFTGSDVLSYMVLDVHNAGASATVRIGVGQFPADVPAEHIARSLDATASSGGIQHDLSDDGRFVAFLSAAALVADDTNGLADVYVFDRLDGGLERVSISSAGVEGDGACGSASISGDGNRIAFASTSSNLVAGDTNSVLDVFVHDRTAGTTIRVSVGPGGVEGTAASYRPEISASGTVVAFESWAFELVANDANGKEDVFVRDLEAGTTTRVSVTSAGGESDGNADDAALSADGHVVAFRSVATNLVAGDANGKIDVFVRDLVAGTTVRASTSSTGVEGNHDSSRPSLSEDGRFVAFISRATNLTTDGTGTGYKAFVRDRQASTTTYVALQTSSFSTSGRALISGDGRYVVGHHGQSFVYDRYYGETHWISGDGGSNFSPVISRNGKYVAVLSNGAFTPLPPGTTGTQVFVVPRPS